MSKCGKGCMPECEYFTTGGCISPFNCQYKIETGYINSATSIPTYMEKQMSMTAEEIEHCLERFTMGKTTDVMNFDYAGTLAYIQRLKVENAALRERLGEAVNKRVVANMLAKYFDCPCNFSPIDEEMFDFCNECCNDNVICWEKVIEKSNAEARLAELKGGKER